MTDLLEGLGRIEEKWDPLIELRVPRDYFSTADEAELVGKCKFAVRERCRLGRVNREKPDSRPSCDVWFQCTKI